MFYENYCDVPGYYTEIGGESYISLESLGETSRQTSLDEEDVIELGDSPTLKVDPTLQPRRDHRRSLWLY